MRLMVIEDLTGRTRRAPSSMEVEHLCRYRRGATEWLLMSTDIGLVRTPGHDGQTDVVAGELVREPHLDEVTWANPSLPRIEAGEGYWLVVGRWHCVCHRPGATRALTRRQAARAMLGRLLMEQPGIATDPVVQELISELPDWDEEDEDDEDDC